MLETAAPKFGTIAWIDLTAGSADGLRDLNENVVGWTTSEVDMGGYSDYCMNRPDSGEAVAALIEPRS